ncbi:GNAT family N-acetyltransferase [Neptunicella marina]|uniref:GNAT family N-acetyltransferase n=1 Tax=Neptunicella marina TaxID=2125989 RepID=A0A8J6IQB1_9ALTE|nr:GNAT family N-acetyltransferase [Neptunicella marina]MBC3765031.1 GNAT family N-acetyltransferase [Neptunicella marina]
MLKGYQVVLRDINQDDLSMLRDWRNSAEVSRYMLSQEQITAEQQLAWFNKIQRDESQQHWIIEYKQQAIGSINIKANTVGKKLTEAKELEVGLYIADNRYRGNIVAFAPTLLVNDYCFNQLGVEALIAVVKTDNQAALSYNQKLGYQLQKQQDNLQHIRLNQANYEQATSTIKQLLSRPSKH